MEKHREKLCPRSQDALSWKLRLPWEQRQPGVIRLEENLRLRGGNAEIFSRKAWPRETPDSSSTLLQGRDKPPTDKNSALKLSDLKLNVEIAEDEAFARVVATTSAPVSAASDWTCRVLVGGLKPGRVYWYRFTDSEGSWQPCW